jgi:hypothetical protein
MFDLLEAPVSNLPEKMAEMTPGSDLARMLESVDRGSLSDFDRVELLKARARLRAHVEAELLADMVSILDAESVVLGSGMAVDVLHEAAAAEIGAALSWTRRAAERNLDFATTLLSEYRRVWEMLHSGLIDLPRARVIVEHTLHLEDEVRDQVVVTAMERAPAQTTGLLAARIKKLAIWVAPENARRRYESGLEERRLVMDGNPDGTANLSGLQLPAIQAQAASRRINRLAHQLKASGDTRSVDQMRADIYLDLLSGGGAAVTGADRGVVDIHVELTTLLELDDQPAELPGWGPVISDVARRVVDEQVEAEWRYTVRDENGTVIGNGTTRRRPTAAERRKVQAQAPTCVFPGCRISSTQSDLDHNRPWSDDGPTETENLGPLCRHHHVIRHHGWRIQQIDPGVYQLTSPLGHTYTTQPRAP